MKHLTASLALAAALVAAANAGVLVTADIAVASGSTNATADITLNRDGSWTAPAIDAVIVSNGGGSVGRVDIAAADLGVERSLGTSGNVAAGAGATVYPVRQWTVGAETNNASLYRARTLRLAVYQNNTNAATYTVGVLTAD